MKVIKNSVFLAFLCLPAIFTSVRGCYSAPYKTNDSITKKYDLILQDSPSLKSTMRQSNENYLSSYRFLVSEMNEITNPLISELIQFGAVSIILLPLTHEEGHRSILSANGIGAISKPYFNKYGAAYVTGVTDETLQNMRDNDLPTYIRLHTAGLESDYMLTKRMETIGAFSEDKFRNYAVDYYSRKLSILSYYFLSLVPYFEPNLEEETNELERDIVGHDVYGAIRHLHRPDMNFYRYTRYADLTGVEKKHLQRVGVLSLINLLHPAVYGKPIFNVGNNTHFSTGLGYTMAPFGDFIDENLWLRKGNLKSMVYVREYFNNSRVFLAGGAGVYDFPIISTIGADLEIHVWDQPKDMDFNTTSGQFGYAMDFLLRYKYTMKRQDKFMAWSINLGVTYKEAGFLPEQVMLDEDLGFRIGMTIYR